VRQDVGVRRDLVERSAPDPARAHGAWVYVGTSVLAGAAAAGGRGRLAALFAGIAFIGVFLVASALALYPRRWKRRFLAGAVLALAACGIGLGLGADPWFVVYASIALFPAGAAVWYATRDGVQSPIALAFAVVALTVSAPAAACAGGADPALGWLLVLLLAPFFVWRTWTVRRKIAARKGLGRRELRRLGLREALVAVSWTALALVVVHVV
jgi:hypothetical protein